MTVQYQIELFESDVFVVEKGEAFHLTICSRVNPLGFGNQLAIFATKGQAIDAAEKFCKMYALAKQYGYHLKDSYFVKEGCEALFVPALLEDEANEASLQAKLEGLANARREALG